MFQELLATENPPRLLHQMGEDPVLGGRQIQPDVAPSHPLGDLVEEEVARLIRGLSHAAFGSADKSGDAGHDLPGRERFADIVVDPGLQAGDPFALAHSFTLALSALGIFRIPASLVEPGIAASIVVMAMVNLWYWQTRRETSGWTRLAIVFGCGLLHGFGFASAIGAMAVDAGSRLSTLAGFNVGVEIGQFLFLAAVSLVITALARTQLSRFQAHLPQLASLTAAGLGLVLLIQRLA